MPKVKELPRFLQSFAFHGVVLSGTEGQVWGTCIFCQSEKFSVNASTGGWGCKACTHNGWVIPKGGSGKGLGPETFLYQLWEHTKVDPKACQKLAENRGFLKPETVSAWGLLPGPTGEWLVPAWNVKGELHQLYRYGKVYDVKRKEWHMHLLPTPGIHSDGQVHGLFGPRAEPWKDECKKPALYICEAPWDGMALWEMLQRTSMEEGDIFPTLDPSTSLGKKVQVLAVPSCGVWQDAWTALCKDRGVVLLYDNDHPRTNDQGQVTPPAGWEGMRKLTGYLAAQNGRAPKSVHYLHWGSVDTEDHNQDLKAGFDVRDLLTGNSPDGYMNHSVKARCPALSALFRMTLPASQEWLKGGAKGLKGPSGPGVLPCTTWAELRRYWLNSTMEWVDELDRALSVALAVAISTEGQGNQVWMILVGPPSSAKTIICQAIGTDEEHCVSESIIKGFHSGWKTDNTGATNHGMVELIDRKTLITKDGDTLLRAGTRDQIMAQARDLYDGSSSARYLNGQEWVYLGHRMTWLIAATESIRELDDSDLGERLLSCVVVEDMKQSTEEEVGLRVAMQAFEDVTMPVEKGAVKVDCPELAEAKQRTGGYLQHLKRSPDLIKEVKVDEVAGQQCQRLGMLCSFLRPRPARRYREKYQRELSFRLISQLARLARCLAVVLNRESVDAEVMDRVAHVAFSTMRGHTLEIAHYLMAAHREEPGSGLLSKTIAQYLEEGPQLVSRLLYFMKKIGAVDLFGKGRAQGRWRLTDRLIQLYDAVVPTRLRKYFADETEGEEEA